MSDEPIAMSSGQSLKARTMPGRSPFFAPAVMVGSGAALVLLSLVVLGHLSPVVGTTAVLGVAGITALALRTARGRSEDETMSEPPSTLDASVAKFASILTEPCLIINDRAVLVHANTAALQRFPRAQAGDPLAFTLRDPDLVTAIDAAFESKRPQRCEIHIATPNDTWFRAIVAPYTPDGRDGVLGVITLHDFTAQKRADRMRSDFIANASHELRTPLTSLMGFIDTLQGPAAKDAAARERFLAIMRSQSERMSGLIDDLLSLSRIELRQHVRPTTPVNLNLLIREVAESLEPRLGETGITLDLLLPDDPVSVTGDRQELFEVVENLADNAIKYGGDGGRVEIALVAGASRAGDQHAITVTDYGAGVAEEHVPRLTERFYRVDAESSRKKKGTGLGLAIVKHIVARHHGQMSIRSRLGEGTRVEILLPR
ncbi:ATP-binding protein [Pelagibacterium luteolum]|nr:ATP-binding protein [Pelagibacterium luteolum]